MGFWEWLNDNPGWFALYLFLIVQGIAGIVGIVSSFK